MEGRLTQWKSVGAGTRESPKRAGRPKAREGNKRWEAHTAEACIDLGRPRLLESPQATGRIRDTKPSVAENKRVNEPQSEQGAHKGSLQAKEALKKGRPP